MKKSKALGATLIAFSAAAILALFFPRLMKGCMEKCREKMAKEGCEPPEFCQKIMDKFGKPKTQA